MGRRSGDHGATTAVQAVGHDAIDADSLRACRTVATGQGWLRWLTHVALSVWLLLRRLLDWRYALVAVSLLVLDPYYMGLSRLRFGRSDGLHVGRRPRCSGRARDRHCRYLVIAGVATGRSYQDRGRVVVLFVVAQVAIPPYKMRRAGYNLASWRSRIRSIAIYGLITVATVFMLWPAM